MNLHLFTIFTSTTILGSNAFLSPSSINGSGMKGAGVGVGVGVGGFGMHHIPRSISNFVLPSSSTTGSSRTMQTQTQTQSKSKPSPLQMVATSTSTSSSRITTKDIQDLHENGYVVIPNFISPDLVSRLREDVSRLRSQDKFNVAKIGQDSTNSLNTDIRVAETCFIGESKLQDVRNPARDDELYTILDTVRMDLSGNPLLDVTDDLNNGELIKASPALDKSLTELLYAYYPKGGYYRRHVDAVPNSASVLRSYSLLLYLNDGEWDSDTNGGCLRVHLDSGKDFLPDNEPANYVDVTPDGGSLVLFRSEQIPHEVLDTAAERTAVVGWYNRPYTSADISSLASEEDKKRGMMLMLAAGLVTAGVGLIIAG